MKEFLLVFRAELATLPKGSPEEMQQRTKQYMAWIDEIAAKGKLKDRGNRLTPAGKVLRTPELATDGPYMEIKESILGYSIILADSYDEAAEIARTCPIFSVNGCVEIREISQLNP